MRERDVASLVLGGFVGGFIGGMYVGLGTEPLLAMPLAAVGAVGSMLALLFIGTGWNKLVRWYHGR